MASSVSTGIESPRPTDKRDRWSASGGVGLFVLSSTWFLAAQYLSLNRPEGSPSITSTRFISDLLFGFAVVAFAGLGALVLVKRPELKLGWSCAAVGIFGSMSSIGSEYSFRSMFGDTPLPLGTEIGWLIGMVWPGIMFGIVTTLVLFPTGQLISRRWRIVVWMAAFTWLLIATAALFVWDLRGPALMSDNVPGAPRAYRILTSIAMPLLGITILAAAASVVVRFRRSTGATRQQIKWIATAGFFLAAAILVGGMLEGLRIIPPEVFNVMAPLALNTIPLAAGVAILKYNLFDIDIVINKTIVYGALAAFITAVYVGVVVGIGSVVGSSDRPNIGLSLTATAIVAIAFQPVRLRVQRVANKLVYGERVTPYEAITGFSHRIAETLTFDQVLPQMAEAAAKGVGAVSSRVTLIQPSGDRQGFTHGDASHSFFQVPVIHQGEEVGEIAVAKAPGEQLTKAEQDLLKDLASQAGLAMRNLRLTAELQAKLEELQASRKRIVKAQDEERRRMERDIHDGAQQQLVAMSVKLGMAKTMLAKDPTKTKQLLEQVKVDTSEAVDSLRDLARGVFPQMLAVKGLGNAVQGHVEKMGIDATVEDRLDGARFDPEIEANIYFCIREALQNASKHAPGAAIRIALTIEGDDLVFTVKDDGPGFDLEATPIGSGLTNMKDRVEALGGTFVVDRHDGTAVEGVIPVKVLERA